MRKTNDLGRRAASAALSAAMVLSLCPVAPIQTALAAETGESDAVADPVYGGGYLG